MVSRIKNMTLLFLALLAIAGCSDIEDYNRDASATLVDENGTPYLAHEVIFMPSIQATEQARQDVYDSLGATVISQDSPLSTELGYIHLQLPGNINANEAMSVLLQSEIAESVDKNYLMPMTREPNDSRWSYLWGMHSLHGPEAWNLTTGSRDIVVAVMDTGVDYNHSDLADNMWSNKSEIPSNGIDDDANGFVDDIVGWHFDAVTGTAGNDPMDIHGHGSHVSGTIGAVGNNNNGVVGVNWQVQIMALNVFHNTSSGPRASFVDMVNAIKYAANNGAQVLNASLGAYYNPPGALVAAIQSLQDNGGMFIAASGNDGVDTDIYNHNPSNVDLENVISVAALAYNSDTGQHELCDGRHGWGGGSNYGATSVDIGAAGHNILSTMPSGAYAYMSGTSMASPHVAGATALFLSMYPDVTVSELRQALLNSADATGELAGKSVTGSRLNVFRMINDHIPPPSTPEDFVGTAGPSRNIELSWTQPESETEAAQYLIQWGTTSGEYTQSTTVDATQLEAELTSLLHGAAYYIVIQAVGDRGQKSTLSVEISVTATDATPPASVIDLVASSFEGALQEASVLSYSGEVSDYWAANNVADGDPSSAWFVPPSQSNAEQYIVLQLSETSQLEQLELLPSEIYPDFFPVDFDIEVSQDGISFSAVGFGRSVSASPNQWHLISFEPRPARFIRLKIITSFQHESGLFYSGLAEIRARGVSEEGARIRLRFTAPGDDPGRGHAENYRVYHSTGRNGENLVNASLIEMTQSPLDSGLLEDFVTPELEPETTYHFQLSAVDAAGNISGLSNIATASTRLMPPAPINDLSVQSTTPSSVLLRFSPTGQNGNSGVASSYDVRYSTSPITAASFYQSTQTSDLVNVTDSNQMEISVSALTENQVYYFAVKGIDIHGLAGSISNIVSAIPQSTNDTTSPATLDDLVGWPVVAYQAANATLASASSALSGLSGAANLLDAVATTDWRITSQDASVNDHVSVDLGASLPLDRIRLYRSIQAGAHASFPQGLSVQVSSDHANWLTVVTAAPVVLPDTVFVEYELPATHARYVRLSITQLASAPPGSANLFYAHIAEMEIMVRDPPTFDVDLTWIAPGDDGWFGTADSYQLYHATHAINSDNYDGNTVESLTTASPAPGGMIEVASTLNLGFETTHYFSLKTVDESGNASELSNNAVVIAPPLPPAPIMDLRVASPAEQITKTGITLTFTATGDDGYLGNPSSVDIRYHSQPITWDNWNNTTAAFLIHDPALSPGPTHAVMLSTAINPLASVEVTINDLDSSTDYYFAARVWDDAGNGSLLSNIAQATTLDGTAPGAIVNLSASFTDPTAAPPQVLTPQDSSAVVGNSYLAENLLDDNAETDWMTSEPAPYFEVNLDSEIRLGKVRFLFSTLYWDLTPSTVNIFTRLSDNDPWVLAAGDDVVEYEAGWQEWAVGSIAATSIRVELGSCAGCNSLVALAGFEAYEDPSDFTTIELMWTAPGDDEQDLGAGAANYDLRRATTPIQNDNDFSNASYRYTDEPAFANREPLTAGLLERFIASDLEEESEYCFALTATDELSNTSALSNSACAFTRGTPPSTIFDLSVVEGTVESSALTLTFTAPAVSDDEVHAQSYAICYQEMRITTTNWDTCTLLENPPTPQASGTQTIPVSGLVGATRYYFAVRSQDIGGNWSAISNNARATTEDDIPPSRIIDLIAIGDQTGPGRAELHWTTPADDQAQEMLLAYDIRWRVGEPVTDTNWNSALTLLMPVPPVPAPPGSVESHMLTGVPRDAQVYFGIRASDSDGNWSQVSNSPVATTMAEDPERVTDLAVTQGPQPLSVSLAFTAPGANDTPGHTPRQDGRATSYDIRYSTLPIGGDSNFYNDARTTQFIPSSLIQPLAPGASESITVDGLESETLYYFAMVVLDEWGRTSFISNNVNFTTSDVLPPAEISDFSVEPGSIAGALFLSWTSPADDGSSVESGKVHHYDILAAPTAWTDEPDTSVCASPCKHVALGSNLSNPQQGDIFTMSGLTGELHYYVAMRACDEAGNCSDYSYVDSMSAGYPPNAVTDLTVSEPVAPVDNISTVVMAWSAPADTGSGGTIQAAASYTFGYSLLPIITTAQFNDAGHTTVHNPGVPVVPATPGTQQSTSITGLQTGVTYYFAIVSYDEMGRASAVTAVPYSTIDITAPDPVSDFVAVTGSGYGAVYLSWTPPGDDGDVGTIASIELYSSAVPTTGESCLTTDSNCTPHNITDPLASSRTITALADEAVIYFALRACDEASNCSPFTYTQARTRDVAPNALNFNLVEESRTTSSFQIQFTAPGDDADTGTAQEYFVYVSTSPITAGTLGDDDDVRVSDTTPLEGGQPVVVTVQGLTANNTYYVAGFARDERDNDGSFSNVLETTTIDTVAPGIVTDLVANSGSGNTVIALSWTATGDEGSSGTAERYLIRYNNSGHIQSESEWDNATQWTGSTPVARLSGLAMTATLAGLQHEIPYYFMVRAEDEDGNIGGLGNSEQGFTQPIAPARINTLWASVLGVSVTLNWTAPGDDGSTGDAVASYDLRRSTSPISESSFGDAESVDFPNGFSPASPGSAETLTVTCPEESTIYYFAIKAIDTFGAQGSMSNTTSVTTDDLTAPASPSNLTATNVTSSTGVISAQSVVASSVLGPGWSADNSIDGNATSPWASEGSTSPQTETLTIDLGSVHTVDRIALRPDGLYTSLFPSDFDLLVSEDGSSWVTVATETGFNTVDDSLIVWGFTPQDARYLKLASYTSGSISTPEGSELFYVLLAEMQAFYAAEIEAGIQLTWMTPGDDDATGTATQYEVFYSNTSFSTSTLNTASTLSGAPVPLSAGSLQTLVVESLPGESTYYFAMRAIDEAGNIGDLSSIAQVTTQAIAPGATGDLSAESTSSTSVALTFSSSYDDGPNGSAVTSYELRYSQGVLTSNNFGAASLLTATPALSGTTYTVSVENLSPGTVYRFAMKSFDESGHASYMSNIALAQTDTGPDLTAPLEISDFRIQLAEEGQELVPAWTITTSSQHLPDFGEDHLADGSYSTGWATEPATTQNENQVRIGLSEESYVDSIHLIPAPGLSNLFPRSFTIEYRGSGLSASWQEIGAFENYSHPDASVPLVVNLTQPVLASAVRMVVTEYVLTDGLYYAVLGEFEIYRPQLVSGNAFATWTAPADIGPTGNASSYAMTSSDCPWSTQGSQDLALDLAAPRSAGYPERAELSLSSGTYCFGLTATDTAGNQSPAATFGPVVIP